MVRKFGKAVEQLIQKKMASGNYASEDELMMAALSSLDAEEEELRAVQAGSDSVDAGDEGTPLDVAFDKLRAKYADLAYHGDITQAGGDRP